MNLENRTVWQQASGDTNRDYAALCLKHGVILNGYELASEPEPVVLSFMASDPLAQGSPPAIQSLKIKPRKKSDLYRFCHRMQPNDIVVLRKGTAQVFGVGVVRGPYFYDDQFGDVDGWSLPFVRPVAWHWSGHDGPRAFSTWELKRGDTTQLLKPAGSVRDWLVAMPELTASNDGYQIGKLSGQRRVQIEDVSDYLFDHGVASVAIRALGDQIGELERIAKWYQRANHSPSESETVAYLVVPLLRTLGWTPQLMAVEWHHVDVALFASLPRSDETLRAVVEVKKMHDSCLTAESQAKRYAEGKLQCDRLILTDGLRYAVHLRDGDGPFRLAAYLNLTRMRDRYPVLDCAGACEALLLMSPQHLPR